MVSERNRLESAIASTAKAIEALEGSFELLPTQPTVVSPRRIGSEPSYIELAAEVIKEAGRAMHIVEIAETLTAKTGATVSRGALEGSISRHVKKAKAPQLKRVGPSTYDVPKANTSEPTLANIA